jgi:hypothetical protein
MRISSPAIRPFASSQKRSALGLSVETISRSRSPLWRLHGRRIRGSRGLLPGDRHCGAGCFHWLPQRGRPPMSGRVWPLWLEPVRCAQEMVGQALWLRWALSSRQAWWPKPTGSPNRREVQTDGKYWPFGPRQVLGATRQGANQGGCPCGRYRLPPRKFAKMVNGLGSLEMAPCAALRNFSICMTFSMRKSRNSHVAAFCSLESDSQYRSVAP